MSKIHALVDFFESFTWDAYDEASVPDDAGKRYITYEVKSDSIGNVLATTVNLWDYNESWLPITNKAEEIAERIVTMYPMGIPLNNGRLVITKGTPFAQRMPDEPSPWKRIVININIEFLTNY